MELETLERAHKFHISVAVAHGDAKPIFSLSASFRLDSDPSYAVARQSRLVAHGSTSRQPGQRVHCWNDRGRREGCEPRQFLLATQNANTSVFCDAEWNGVSNAEEKRRSLNLEAQGSIGVPAIRAQGMRPAKSSTQLRKAQTWCALKLSGH